MYCYCCLMLYLCLSPACTFTRIFWTFLLDLLSSLACAWLELPLLFELLLNILTIILLLSLLLGPQSFQSQKP